MEATYRKLDMSKLRFRKHHTVSMEDALKDVTPMKWKDTVYTCEEKVFIDKQGIHYVQNR